MPALCKFAVTLPGVGRAPFPRLLALYQCRTLLRACLRRCPSLRRVRGVSSTPWRPQLRAVPSLSLEVCKALEGAKRAERRVYDPFCSVQRVLTAENAEGCEGAGCAEGAGCRAGGVRFALCIGRRVRGRPMAYVNCLLSVPKC